MRLEQLHATHFRTYAKLDLSFPEKLTFIIGNNATGKTNILEAVSVLSIGKSFRGASDADLVQHGCTDYFVRGVFHRQGRRNIIEVGCDVSGPLRRRIRINERAVNGRAALVGRLTTVIFSPADISIVEGGPAERRRFLDLVLCSREEQYLANLLRYNRTLQQRNAVLKRARQNRSTADLGVWNAELSEMAAAVTHRRLEFVAEFAEVFTEALGRISGSRDQLQLSLAPSQEGEFEDFASALSRNEKRDRVLGYTTVGPHRQNLLFQSDGRDVITFGSQGQRRTLVLALRIAQFRYLRSALGVSPLLLIDDVLRELDANRRHAFIELLHESAQALFTTPDLDGLREFPTELREQALILKVIDQGVVEPQAFAG